MLHRQVDDDQLHNCVIWKKSIQCEGENPFASITNQIICKHTFKKKSLCFELEVKEMAFIVCVCGISILRT